MPVLNVLVTASSENHVEKIPGFCGNQGDLRFCEEYSLVLFVNAWIILYFLTVLTRNTDLMQVQFSENRESKSHTYRQTTV